MILRIFVAFLSENIEIEVEENISDKINNWDLVLIKTEEWLFEWAIISKMIPRKEIKPNKDINFVRKANEIDLQKIDRIRKKEVEMLDFFKIEYKKYNLKLEPISSVLSFDEKMALFTFSADNRIDFRELLKWLAWKFRKRIKLKHMWARDRAQLVWWVWVCGNETCCSRFLKDLPSVTMSSVKVQDLTYKNMDNLSWLCGKLKCCLNYETETYRELKKKMPKVWSQIDFEWEKWKIIWMDVFNQKIKMKTSEKFQIVEHSEIKQLIKK